MTLFSVIILVALLIPAGSALVKSAQIASHPRFIVITLSYIVFTVNEVIYMSYGAPFYFYHVLIDCILISIAIPSFIASGRSRFGFADSFLFHYAILYLAIFSVVALALAGGVSNSLAAALLFLIAVFTMVIFFQTRPREIIPLMVLLLAWVFVHLQFKALEPILGNGVATIVFFIVLAITIQGFIYAADRKLYNEKQLLGKSRDAVMSMLNDLSSSEEYLTSIDNTILRVLKSITDSMSVESVALYRIDNQSNEPTLKYYQSAGQFYPVQPVDEFVIRSRQLVKDFLKQSTFKIGEGVVGTVAQNRRPLLLSSLTDHHMMAFYGINARVIHNVLAIPFMMSDQLDGVIMVQNARNGRTFGMNDVQLLQFLADQASISIKNTDMYMQLTRTTRLRQEANIATKIQIQLLPKDVPVANNMRLSAFFKPAKEVGGDYYDFVAHSDGTLDIIIGDVSGKGVPAGMIMAIAKAILQIISQDKSSVMEIVSKFTKEIYINMNNGQFMTLNYLRWYDDTRTLSFAGAGHEHVLWFHKGTGRSEKIRTGGLAAGLVDNADDYIKQNNLQLENGDVVLLYTDGVTEARNTGKEMFTINRLQAALESYAYLLHPEKIRDLIIKDIYGFMGSEEQYDDITLLVLSVAGQEKTHTATVKALEPENASV